MTEVEVEQDVARIQAVTAKLAGPQWVWALIWASNDSGDHGFMLYRTKEKLLADFEDFVFPDYGYDDYDACVFSCDVEEATRIRDEIAELAEKLALEDTMVETEGYEYTIQRKQIHDA